jgi:hypothetical protein
VKEIYKNFKGGATMSIKDVWKQILQEEVKQNSSQVLSYPAPQIKINHDKAIWMLGDAEELGNQLSFFVVRTYAQTTVFNSNGNLVLKSQIFVPRERNKALVLYSMNGIFTGQLLVEALKRLEEEEFSVINSWLLPIVITSTKEPTKAIWEAKRSALKVLINFMREENLNTLTGHELTVKLVKQKSGVKQWSEPKVIGVKSIENVDEVVLKVAYDYLSEFEQFRTKYNNSIFSNTQEDDIPLEL